MDVQNEFCHPDGFFARNLCECNPEGFFKEGKLTLADISDAVSDIEKVIGYFRSSQLPIVYVKAVSDPEYLSPLRFERYKGMYERGFLKDGTWSTEFYRISPLENEMIFKKGGYNPFCNPQFKEHILGTASSIVLTGFFSDVCIDATARTADEIDVGVPTEVIADCSKSLLRSHEENLKYMHMFYNTSIHRTVEDFVRGS